MAVKSSKTEGLTDYIPKIMRFFNSTFLVDDVGQGGPFITKPENA